MTLNFDSLEVHSLSPPGQFMAPVTALSPSPIQARAQQYWDLGIIQKESLWILTVKITKGVPDKLPIDYEDFGLTPDEALTFRKENKVDKLLIEAFSDLNRAYSLLTSFKKARIQKPLMRCFNDVWFVLNSDVSLVQDQLDLLEIAVKVMKGALPLSALPPQGSDRFWDNVRAVGNVIAPAVHEAGAAFFCDRLKTTLLKFGARRRKLSAAQIDEVLYAEVLEDGRRGYFHRFPSRERIEAEFDVFALWMKEIKSIQESVAHDTALQQLAVANQEAQAQSEAAELKLIQQRRAAEAALRMQRNNEQMLERTCQGLMAEVRSQLLEAVQQNLSRLAGMKQAYDRKATTLLKSSTEAILRETLKDLDRNLKYARTLHEWGVQGTPPEIEALVSNLKQTQTQMLDWRQFDQVGEKLQALQAQIDGIKGTEHGAGQRQLTALGTLL